ncbi:Origin recognition complex, subunit 1 [Lambiella insularis]|nr:Origin recognition complex, subunit 1 [Lambiella insularis]
MPHKTNLRKRINAAKTERARDFLRKGGVSREDSDDELGYEDYPWEWVFAQSKETGVQKIVGACMGSFQCMLGDCVLLKAESNEAWVGLICDFQVEEEEKMANFMWFSTPKEISRGRRNKQILRSDALPNELYITPASDINPLASINGKATVMSLAAFAAKYPSGKIPRSSKHYGKTFVCRRGLDTKTAFYTDDFVWEDLYKGEQDINKLIRFVEAQTQAKAGATRKRRRDREYEHEEHEASSP